MQRSNDLHVGEDVQCWDEEHAKTLGRVFEHGNEPAAVAAAFKIYSEVQVVNANPAANYRVQQDAPTPPCQSIRRETPFVIKSNPFYIAIKDIGLSRRAAAALMLGIKAPNWKLRPRIVGMKGLCKAG